VNETVKRFCCDGLEGLSERCGGYNRLERRYEAMKLLPELVGKNPCDYGWARSTWGVELIGVPILSADVEPT